MPTIIRSVTRALTAALALAAVVPAARAQDAERAYFSGKIRPVGGGLRTRRRL